MKVRSVCCTLMLKYDGSLTGQRHEEDKKLEKKNKDKLSIKQRWTERGAHRQTYRELEMRGGPTVL